MGFITKLARVETEFGTEEQWEKWEGKRNNSFNKELRKLEKQKRCRSSLGWGGPDNINRVNLAKRGDYVRTKYVNKEEAISFSKFTYETHSLKETKDLQDKIRDTAEPGTVINWVVREEEEKEAIESRFCSNTWSSTNSLKNKKLICIRVYRD